MKATVGVGEAGEVTGLQAGKHVVDEEGAMQAEPVPPESRWDEGGQVKAA